MFLGANGRPESFANVGVGGLAVGVPGALRMLELAHREHGRLPWADLFAPAIELAENGFEVSPRLFGLLNGFKRFARGDDFRSYFYDANGEPHPVGYRLKNPEYAAALKLLAAGGAEPMHTGELAAAIAAEVRDNNVRPGRMTPQDLAAYEANVSAPLCTPYRAWRVCGPQLPSSGGVTTQQVLGMLVALRAAGHSQGAGAGDSPVRRGQPARVCRSQSLPRGPAVRARRPSPGCSTPSYLRARAALIDPTKAMATIAPGEPLPAAAWEFAPGDAFGAAVDEPLLDRRPLRRRGRDDDERAGRVRQPAHGRRVHLEQPTDGLRLRADGRRQAGSEPRRRRQAAAVEHVADDAARRARAAAASRRLAGRHAHHRLRRAEHRRRRRLGARRAASRRRAALPRRRRAHRARRRHGDRGSRAGARGAWATTWR